MKTKDIIRDFKDISADYVYVDDIFTTDDERVAKLKKIINQKLSLVDKTIILLYVDCLSYRKLGKRLGLHHMTIRKEVLRIMSIIKEEFSKGNECN